jgi:uncharacterized protein YndB with AHSA1/START domain
MTVLPPRIERVTDSNTLLITRVFNAPRETVFQAWTHAALLIDWWGRHDFTNPVCEFEAHVGGRFHIVMRSADGVDYPVHGQIREIECPMRLVLDLDLSDYPTTWRDVLCADLSEDDAAWVNDHQLDLTLTASGARTQLDLLIHFPSPTLRNAFLRCGILNGWEEGFDSLEALLSRYLDQK